MTVVQSRIASFEAYNEEERLRSPSSSPRRHTDTSTSPRNHNSNDKDDNNNMIQDISPDRRPSTTNLASQSRIHRLKREASTKGAGLDGSTDTGTNIEGQTQQQTFKDKQSIHNKLLQHGKRAQRINGSLEMSPPRKTTMTPVFRKQTARSSHTQKPSPAGSNGTDPPGKGDRAAASANDRYHSNGMTARFQNAISRRRQHQPLPTQAQQQRIQQPDLNASAEHESDPDGPLLPRRNGDSDVTRRDKMQKVQTRRHKLLMDRKSLGGGSTTGEADGGTSSSMQQQEQQHYEQHPQHLSPESPSRHTVLEAEDDITLTSVRQIVDTNKRSDVDDEEDDRNDSGHQKRMWMPDPSSDKPSRLLVAPSQSSDCDTDYGDDYGGAGAGTNRNSQDNNTGYAGHHGLQNPSRSGLSASQMTPDISTYFEQKQQRHDDDTYDYGRDENDDDNDSQESLTYHQRLAREQKEKEARRTAVAAAKADMDLPFVQPEDVEHYRKSLDTPVAKTAAVIAGAAAVGCIVLGPIGLLVGAAAVGIGAGAMQIPEEQRNNMLNSAQESAVRAGDAISNSCVHTYRDSGIAERLPPEVQSCCAGLDGETPEVASVMSELEEKQSGEPEKERPAVDSRGPVTPTGFGRDKSQKGKVACLREGRIVPVAQIHALNPADQPRAWLDVLASASTTHEERLEAMEEVLILAKDKQRARIFVEEGILDSLMWTLGRFFEKSKDTGGQNWAQPEISNDERAAARLAATCCLTLGKAYCAAMHTDGDLLLMSLYERGSVPEERQLAQMLHEVPHHVRVTKTEDPTVVDPSSEIFALRQMSLPQAEELSVSIKTLAEASI